MASTDLPLHPTKRHPLTGQPLRAIWVRPDGRVCWPVMGGDETADAAAAAAAAATKAAEDKAAAEKAAAAAASANTDHGFPSGTPVEEMTAPQREAYYKHNQQKWQGRAENSYGLLNKLGAKTPEEIDAILEKVNKHDALERELMSEKDRAVDDAKREAAKSVRDELVPELIRTKFEAAAAGRLTEEQLAVILEPLDLTKFLTPDGKVDTSKVKTYVDGVAPAKGNQRSGPSSNGLGGGNGGGSGGKGRASAGSVAEVMEERRRAREAKTTTSTS